MTNYSFFTLFFICFSLSSFGQAKIETLDLKRSKILDVYSLEDDGVLVRTGKDVTINTIQYNAKNYLH